MVTRVVIIASLFLTALSAHAQDKMYMMNDGSVINEQSLLRADLDSIIFYDFENGETASTSSGNIMYFVGSGIIVNSQSVVNADLDSIILYDPRGDDDPVCTSSDPADFIFVEKDGLLTIEAENVVFNNADWKILTDSAGYLGTGAIQWTGASAYKAKDIEPTSILTYKVRIKNPGVYRLIWRSLITKMSDPAKEAPSTAHNDSWVRIADAKEYFAWWKNNGKAEPGFEDARHYSVDNGFGVGGSDLTPYVDEGNGLKDGWFKGYMNSFGKSWTWTTKTWDSNGIYLYAEFETAGDYTLQIAGRSDYHSIDRIVLYRIPNDKLRDDDKNGISANIDNSNPASLITCD